MSAHITIPLVEYTYLLDRYEDFLDKDALLTAMYNNGVENWEGYNDSRNDHEDFLHINRSRG